METKTCSSCSQELSIDSFAWKSKAKGIRQSRCKQCYSEYNRAYYASGESVNQKKRSIANTKTLRGRFQEWKAQQQCQVCGEDSVECLDLHHVDPSQKDDEISKVLARTGSWKRVEEEISKCVIVCSNCHRKIHSGRIQCPVSSVD